MYDKDNVREDDLVRSLVRDPGQPPNIMLLTGFVGHAAAPGQTRLYIDALLSAFVDIPDEKILRAQKLTQEQSVLGGHHLWVERSAELAEGIREALATSAQLQQELGVGYSLGGITT